MAEAAAKKDKKADKKAKTKKEPEPGKAHVDGEKPPPPSS